MHAFPGADRASAAHSILGGVALVLEFGVLAGTTQGARAARRGEAVRAVLVVARPTVDTCVPISSCLQPRAWATPAEAAFGANILLVQQGAVLTHCLVGESLEATGGAALAV